MSCPVAEIAERAALGVELTHEEEARLSGHDVTICDECRTLTENALATARLLEESFDGIDGVLDRRSETSIAKIQGEIEKIELATPRRMRRVNWRFIFFATNLCAGLLLLLNFTTLVAIVRIHRETARKIAGGEVRTITIALATYRRDHDGALPADAAALVPALAGERPGRPGEIYFRFEGKEQRLGADGFRDPWGRPYRYEVDPAASSGFRFWSVGPDGRDDRGASDSDDVYIPLLDAERRDKPR